MNKIFLEVSKRVEREKFLIFLFCYLLFATLAGLLVGFGIAKPSSSNHILLFFIIFIGVSLGILIILSFCVFEFNLLIGKKNLYIAAIDDDYLYIYKHNGKIRKKYLLDNVKTVEAYVNKHFFKIDKNTERELGTIEIQTTDISYTFKNVIDPLTCKNKIFEKLGNSIKI